MRPLPDMIGHLFGSRKGSSAAHAPAPALLDSATEESHTRHLLYPEINTLYHAEGQPYALHAAALTSGSGQDGLMPEIDLQFPRDCRIIIAQDETPAMPKAILFDSKPALPRAESPNTRARAFGGGNAGMASPAGPASGGLHARRASLAPEPTPRSPTVGGFTRIRARGTSISSMPNIDEHAQVQAKAQARAKESTDLANICLDCMFGNLAMNYRGNSNKIHFVPLDTKPAESSVLSTSVQDGTSSLGRAEGFRRRSHLAKSFTPANIPTELPRADSNDSTSKEPKRRTIFITRMFSVTVPEEEVHDDRTPTPQCSLPNGNGFPFPATSTKPGTSRQPHMSHPRKSPMYAITIILHLPISQALPSMRPPSRGTNLKTPAHFSTSAPGQDSLGSSLDSERRAGWSFIDSNLGGDSLLTSSLSSDVDDRVDVVGQHWDVIMRTLTSLQQVVQERIVAQFKSPDVMSQPVPHHHRNRSSRSSVSGHPMRKALRLQPNALMLDKDIQAAAEFAGGRVVTGMRIPRVMTGQGKWGVWREEARWLGRWAGRKEQNFFFFNLLTAFLGNHTEWLNALGPKWHRKRHREQQKASVGENMTISNRTIIMSPDKMAARRLVFLLAAFLPSNASVMGDSMSYMRPGTSASLRAYSQSPPTSMPLSKQPSLRRQINQNRRAPRGKQSMSNILLQPPKPQSIHYLPTQIAHDRSESALIETPETRPLGHSRRSSAHSIRTSLMIPSMSEGPVTTTSSTTTTSTVIPETTVPVAHFTLPRTRSSAGQLPDKRPQSSDSLASANLANTLQRSGTGQTSLASNDSSNNSRWSGFMNFWSGRRSSSTDQSEYFQTTDDGVGYRGQERPRSQLEQMVQELSMDRVFDSDATDSPIPQTSSTDNTSPDSYTDGGCPGIPASAARPIPERQKTFETHLKLSVNEKDGVIDVDIPLPDFDSPLQSPLLGGFGSVSSQPGSSFGDSSILSMPHCEPEQPVNVAGWITNFHPDFAVQAIKPPYNNLERDVKRAMSAEPTPLGNATTPSLESGPMERWIDVCSALIADTSNFTVKRISLRRLVKLIPTPTYQPSAMTPGVAGMPPGRSQYGNPYASGTAPMMTEIHLAEKFITEIIMDFDATLIEGVDRVLAQSGEVTRVNSAQSSRSSSRRGRREALENENVNGSPTVEVSHVDCKSVIFEALEGVVRDVQLERGTGGRGVAKEQDGKCGKVKTENDSSLKEGVRRWLAEVE
jgi:hypothetical protein